MKKGDICYGYVEGLSFPNRGKVRVLAESEASNEENKSNTYDQAEGQLYAMVKNVIPGQRISFRISKKKHGLLQGQFLELLEKAPKEMQESNCPHFGICGGCTYQTLPYEEQVKIKESQVRELMVQALGKYYVDKVWDGITPSPVEFGYRNKMEFSFGDFTKGGELTLGMHKRGSFYDVVDVHDCCLIHDDIRKVLTTTLEYFRVRDISYFHKMNHKGYLRHLLIRRAGKTGQMVVDLVTSSQLGGFAREISDKDTVTDYLDSYVNDQEKQLIEGWKEAILALDFEGQLMGLLHTHNDRRGDVVEDQGSQVLFGQDYITENLLDLNFKITPFSFFQNNSLGAEKLYSIARDYCLESMPDQFRCKDEKDLKNIYVASSEQSNQWISEHGPVIFDLYSGTGTIAQIISPVAKKVVGVEIVEEAVEAAKENAEKNSLENCQFIAGDVLKVLDDIQEKPDYIILDPPRDGINPKALQKIMDYGVDSIVYISCSPRSLARDLEVIKEYYQVKKIQAVDMFPGTGHVETVVLLSDKISRPE